MTASAQEMSDAVTQAERERKRARNARSREKTKKTRARKKAEKSLAKATMQSDTTPPHDRLDHDPMTKATRQRPLPDFRKIAPPAVFHGLLPPPDWIVKFGPGAADFQRQQTDLERVQGGIERMNIVDHDAHHSSADQENQPQSLVEQRLMGDLERLGIEDPDPGEEDVHSEDGEMEGGCEVAASEATANIFALRVLEQVRKAGAVKARPK